MADSGDFQLVDVHAVLDADEVEWCFVHHTPSIVEGEECWAAHFLEATKPCEFVSAAIVYLADEP